MTALTPLGVDYSAGRTNQWWVLGKRPHSQLRLREVSCRIPVPLSQRDCHHKEGKAYDEADQKPADLEA